MSVTAVQTTSAVDRAVDRPSRSVKIASVTYLTGDVSVDQLRADKEQLSLKLEELEQTSLKQQAELWKSNQRIEEFKAQQQTAQINNEDQRVMIETKDNRIASLSEQLDQANTNVEEFTKISDQLRSRDSQLATANERLRKVEESERKLQTALEDKQKEIKTKGDDIEQMRKSFEAKLVDKDREIAEVHTQNTDLKAGIFEQLKSKNFELEATNNELQEVKNCERQLEAALDEKKKENRMKDDAIEQMCNEFEARLADRNKRIAEVESELATIQTLNQDLLLVLHDKQREIDELYYTFHDDGASSADHATSAVNGRPIHDGIRYA